MRDNTQNLEIRNIHPLLSKIEGSLIHEVFHIQGFMRNSDQQVIGIRVLDISEEGPKAIEAMFNQVIEEINIQETPIIDVQITDNHCFLLLGQNKNK